MSDKYQPNLQQPTRCDFGPFAGKICYKKAYVSANIITSNIELLDIILDTDENTAINIDLRDYVSSFLDIDWSKTIIDGISEGIYTLNDTLFNFVPNKAATVDRVDNFTYTIFDSQGYSVTAPGVINIIDKTPIITTSPITLSGTEAQTYTIDLKNSTVLKNTTVDWGNVNSVTITTQPAEGTVNIASGIVTFKPSETSSVTRTLNIGYKITTTDGLVSNNTISITVTDITPSLTARNVNVSVLDTATKTISILNSITIKNDTFKEVTVNQPSEGNIVINGSNITYTPNPDISGNRTIIVNYTVTTTTGLTASALLNIQVEDDNIWAKTVWYGNSTMDIINIAEIQTLDNKIQTTYVGTYSFTSGSGVYKWLVYPLSYGVPSQIVDPTTNFEVATEDYQYITHEGVELICIRTYYQLNGAYQIKLI